MTAMTSKTETLQASPKILGSSPGPILLALDGSAVADFAARVAVDLAQSHERPLHVVHCWLPLATAYAAGDPGIDIELAYREPAEELLRSQVEELERQGATVAESHLLMGRAAEQVPELARQIHAQLIVVGSRGLGVVKRLVLGSASEGVVHAAGTPVLVVRGEGEYWPPEHILVGADGSEHSLRAAEAAAALAVATGARLTVATVIAQTWMDAASPVEARQAAEARTAGTDMVQKLAAELGAAYGITVQTVVLVGDPSVALIAAVAPGPAVIAVGSRGFGPIKRLAMGSASTEVLHGAHCSVLISH